MKKIFTLCAAMFAAMTMSATVTNMTCAEAAAAAALLDDKSTGTDTVCVTGYVTNTNGTLSPKNGVNQQTFWMDDVKGTTKTFEGYWCNMPSNDEPALNVGDKVSVTGLLMRYGTTYEIKNGAIAILERVVITIDTIADLSLCEVIGEALALPAGENTTDYFQLSGVVTSANDKNSDYNNQTFYFTCSDESDDNNTKTLQVYAAKLMADSQAVAVGDTVEVIGRLMNYNNTAEMTAATVLSVKHPAVAPAAPDTIAATVAEAYAACQLLAANGTSYDYYAVTGYVDSIATAYSSSYNNISFYLCDDMAAPTYNFQCYRVVGGSDIVKGAKVTVTGKLNHYKSTSSDAEAYQMAAKGTYVIVSSPATALENVAAEKAVKMIENGQIIIIRNGVRYNALGAQL